MIAAVAKSIPGLHVHTLLNARSSAAVKAAQTHVDDLATADKVTGTPTLFVGKTGTHSAQVNLASATDEQTLVTAINNVIGRSDQRRLACGDRLVAELLPASGTRRFEPVPEAHRPARDAAIWW